LGLDGHLESSQFQTSAGQTDLVFERMSQSDSEFKNNQSCFRSFPLPINALKAGFVNFIQANGLQICD
jgi:hypothetical protein